MRQRNSRSGPELAESTACHDNDMAIMATQQAGGGICQRVYYVYPIPMRGEHTQLSQIGPVPSSDWWEGFGSDTTLPMSDVQ